MIFAVIPAKSRFEAIAKAAVALNRRPHDHRPVDYERSDQDPTFELLHRYDDSALQTFAGTWGTLPDAAPVTSETGRNILSKAIQNTPWIESDQTSIQTESESGDTSSSEKPRSRLYDEAGNPIERRTQLTKFLEETGVPDLAEAQDNPMISEGRGEEDLLHFGSATEEPWIVPALAFSVDRHRSSSGQRTTRNNRADSRCSRLHCDVCGTTTIHRFDGIERYEDTSETVDHPAGELSDIFVDEYTTELSIWKCSECNAGREGPPLP
ncbi:hypothetical protein [Salinigranum salinum]|uniref:hypothetical protein n=1 Tax=Salinigranum salinum TaxID=1364937 RepID=UPI00126112F9|nr:hypothetical protein [Salinigranum salinum]